MFAKFKAWILSLFNRDKPTATPVATPAPAAPAQPEYKVKEEAVAAVLVEPTEYPEKAPVVTVDPSNGRIRIIDGVRCFWTALQGWTPVPTNYPASRGADFKADSSGPPFAWNMAGQIGQPRFKPDDWEEKGPEYDRDAYYGKYYPDSQS